MQYQPATPQGGAGLPRVVYVRVLLEGSTIRSVKRVYRFSEAKPYFRVKKDGKWTWVAAKVLHNGWNNYMIEKIQEEEE